MLENMDSNLKAPVGVSDFSDTFFHKHSSPRNTPMLEGKSDSYFPIFLHQVYHIKNNILE